MHTQPRVYTEADQLLPRFLIRSVIALVLITLALVSYARLTDRALEAVPPAAPVAAQASVTFVSDGMTGAVDVFDETGAEIVALSPKDGGFIAGVHRVILRERALRGLPAEGPVDIRAFANGRMAVHDPSSGWGADLMGFGADNADAFARLLALIEKGRP